MVKRAHIALLFISLMSVISNGAQAHLGMSAPGKIAMPICGMGDGAVIVLSLGQEAPINAEHESCCGDCVAFAAITQDAPSSVGLFAGRARPQPRQPILSFKPSAPIWPGAPPHGPPALSKI